MWCFGPPRASLEGASSRITPNANGALSTGCNILWIVHAPFLFGAWGCGIISLPRSGEPMRTDPLHAAFQVPPVELPDEARQALKRAIQATLAGFAEMDRLLDRAERLISQQRCSRRPRSMLKATSVPSAEARWPMRAAQAGIGRTSGRPARL